MADNKQGNRSHHDPKAPRNQHGQGSDQSSKPAQGMGSTDKSRSVQSGVSGIASQRHVGADDGSWLEDQVNTTMSSGMGQNRSDNQGTRPVNKGSENRSTDTTGMGTQSDQNATTGNSRNG